MLARCDVADLVHLRDTHRDQALRVFRSDAAAVTAASANTP
jgi:hypothetical protein